MKTNLLKIIKTRKMGKCLSIKEKDANILYEVLYRILKDMNEKDTSTID